MCRDVDDAASVASAVSLGPTLTPETAARSPLTGAATRLPQAAAPAPAARGLRALLADRRGALAPVVAVFVPVALGIAGLAIDASNGFVEQNRLQTAVDEATLVAVQALPDIEAARAAAMRAFAENYAAMSVEAADPVRVQDVRIAPSSITFGRWNAKTRQVEPTRGSDLVPNAVAMTVNRSAAEGQGLDTYFLAALGIRQLDLAASAVAQFQGGEHNGTCIIALEPTAGEAVHVQGNADLIADGCRIRVNSTAGNAITVTGGAGTIRAAEICVAGGAQNSSRMSPAPRAGCAPVADPLAAFTPPSVGTCSHFGFNAGGGSTTLQPGVYCGGLTINSSGTVTMAPGIYVIKDGPFRATGNVTINAKGVALYLVGSEAVLDITGPVAMHLQAPKTGPLAGIAIYQGPNVPAGLTSRMGQGNSTTRIEGTIYLPSQHLSWGGTPGTTLPPWTLLVARTVYVFGNAALRIGTNFEASEVPAPEEFNEKKKVRLVN